jgi:histone arginine demethylase JMJD6
VTENFCNDGNFERVWRDTRSGRKKLACKWLRLLEKHEPAKYELARSLNKEDGFVMYDERE